LRCLMSSYGRDAGHLPAKLWKS